MELLEDYGFAPHLVHPLQCKAIASARLKNDKVDAAILAQLLRADLLPEAWIAPPEVRQLRALLRHRAQLVRLRTLLRNRIHAVLADHGQDRPAGLLERPGPGLARLIGAACRLPGGDRGRPGADRRHPGADRPAGLGGPPARQVRSAGEGLDPAARRGPVHRLVILAEVGDVSRFGSARKLAAWAGLTPTVRGSDRTVRHGHISKQGSAWLRWILCEAAQTAKRHPDFAASYPAIARRRGKKIATTAIARKLLTRTWHLLTDAERAASHTTSAPGSRRGAGTSREGSPSPG